MRPPPIVFTPDDLTLDMTLQDAPPPEPLPDSTYDLRASVPRELFDDLHFEQVERMAVCRFWRIGMIARSGDMRWLLHARAEVL